VICKRVKEGKAFERRRGAYSPARRGRAFLAMVHDSIERLSLMFARNAKALTGINGVKTVEKKVRRTKIINKKVDNVTSK
jgi:hypothetical protein